MYISSLVLFAAFFISTHAVEHFVYFNVSNPEFASKEFMLDVRMGDDVTVICPTMKAGPLDRFMKIYQVSFLSYESCMLETHSKQLIALCDEDDYTRTFGARKTIRILPPATRSSRYDPDGTFVENQSYYWITTSRGNRAGIDNGYGGLCHSRGLRMQMNVLPTSVHERRTTTTSSTTTTTTTTTTESPRRIQTVPTYSAYNQQRGSTANEKARAQLSGMSGVRPEQVTQLMELLERGQVGSFKHSDDNSVDDESEVHQRAVVWNSDSEEDNEEIQVHIVVPSADGHLRVAQQAAQQAGGVGDDFTYVVHDASSDASQVALVTTFFLTLILAVL